MHIRHGALCSVPVITGGTSRALLRLNEKSRRVHTSAGSELGKRCPTDFAGRCGLRRRGFSDSFERERRGWLFATLRYGRECHKYPPLYTARAANFGNNASRCKRMEHDSHFYTDYGTRSLQAVGLVHFAPNCLAKILGGVARKSDVNDN